MDDVCDAVLIIILMIIGGKRDEKLILPTNSSLSVTLNQNEVLLEYVRSLGVTMVQGGFRSVVTKNSHVRNKPNSKLTCLLLE